MSSRLKHILFVSVAVLCSCSQPNDDIQTFEDGGISAQFSPSDVASGIAFVSYAVHGEIDQNSPAKLVGEEFIGELDCGQKPTIHLEAGIDGEFQPIQILSGPIIIQNDVGDVAGNYDTIIGALTEKTDGVSMLVYSNDRLIVEAPFVGPTELIGDSGAQSRAAFFGDGSQRLVEGNIPWCLHGRIESGATNIVEQLVQYGQIKVLFKSNVEHGGNTLVEMKFDMTAFPRVAEFVAQEVRASQ